MHASITACACVAAYACRIEWVWLGHGRAEDILPLVDTMTNADIWEYAAPVAPGQCPEGFK